MSRTFGEIIDDYMKLHDELQNKVFYDVICAERVAVVRCKDCKHTYTNTDTSRIPCSIIKHYCKWCRLHDRPVDNTDYCSWGEESEVEE